MVGKGQQSAFVPSSVLGAPPGTVGDIGTISNGTFIPAGQRFTYSDLLAVGTVVPALADPIAPEREPVRFRGALQAGQLRTPSGGSTICITTTRSRSSASSTIPPITANPFGLGYFLQYGKSRNLFGVSVNGNIGDWAVGAELSYRPKDGVGIDPTVPLAGPYCAFCAPGTYPGYVDAKKWQAHLTTIYLLGPSGDLGWLLRGLGAAEGTLLLEVAAAYYPNLDLSGKYPYLLPNYELPTKLSTGTRVRARRRLSARLRLVGQPHAADRHRSTTSAASARTRFRSSRAASPSRRRSISSI